MPGPQPQKFGCSWSSAWPGQQILESSSSDSNVQPKLRITVRSKQSIISVPSWQTGGSILGGTMDGTLGWHTTGTGNLTGSDASNLSEDSSRQLQITQHHQSRLVAGSQLWSHHQEAQTGRLIFSQATKAAEGAGWGPSGVGRLVRPRSVQLSISVSSSVKWW